MLELLRQEFKCGQIVPERRGSSVLVYKIESTRDLWHKLVPWLDENPPILRKREYHTFRRIVQGLMKGIHKEPNGLIELIKLAYSLSNQKGRRRRRLEDVINDVKRASS